jgi:hypothetical protein
LLATKDAATKPRPSRALELQPAFDSPLTGILQLRAAPRVAPSPLARPVLVRPLTFEQAALLLALGAKRVRALPLA